MANIFHEICSEVDEQELDYFRDKFESIQLPYRKSDIAYLRVLLVITICHVMAWTPLLIAALLKNYNITYIDGRVSFQLCCHRKHRGNYIGLHWFEQMGKKQTKAPNYFIVNDKKYTIVKKIADGGFSTIYKVKCKGEIFALKRIGVHDNAEADKFLEEAYLMKKFSDNKNIIKCFDCCSRPNENGILEVIILMEYCKRNLNQVLSEFGNEKKYNNMYKMMIFNQICIALASFHYCNPPLLHRDIKTENILQQTETNYLLCDFGSVTTKIYDPKVTSFHVISEDINNNTTLAYRSPEMVSQLEGKVISTKADIWALGCLLYKIYHGDTPFGENPGKIIDGFNGFPTESTCPDSVKDLIKSMLHLDPAARPNIYEVHLKASEILSRPPQLSPMQRSILSLNETHFKSFITDSKAFTDNTINSDNLKYRLPSHNPFGQGIVSDMNFSECRRMIQQASLHTESNSLDDLTTAQTSVYSPPTQSNNKNMNKSYEALSPKSDIDQFNNTPHNQLSVKTHTRHRSLNEKMIKLSFTGETRKDSPKSPKINFDRSKKESKFSPHHNESSNIVKNPFKAVNSDSNRFSNDSDLFNPFENKTPSNDCRSFKSNLVKPSIDEPLTDGDNPFKSKNSPIISSQRRLNPFRDDNPIEDQTTPTKNMASNNLSSENSPFSDTYMKKSMEINGEVSSNLEKPKFSNPFLSSTSSFKPKHP